MKNLILILSISLFIVSCNREEQQVQPSNTTSNRFAPSGDPDDFRAIGTCYAPTPPSTNYPSWIYIEFVDIYDSNGQYYIDSLNYVINTPLPITMTSNSSFTFNDYITGVFHIIDGTGYINGDTLIISVNANKTVNCTDQFTFHGKYIQQ